MGQEIVDLTIETTGPQIREMEAAIETEDLARDQKAELSDERGSRQ